MLPFEEALECDRAALELIEHDVSQIPDDALDRPTPCSGWAVRDLVIHMNAEHAAICGGEVGVDADPRAEFPGIADRWLSFFADTAGSRVHVPKVGRDLPSERVISIHFVDMLVHRWDLAVSLGGTPGTSQELLDKALPVARVATAPDSGLVGRHGVYRESLPPDAAAGPLESLVRMYGRDHRFPHPDTVEPSRMFELAQALGAAKSRQDVPAALAVLHPDMVLEAPAFGTTATGRVENEQALKRFFASFPDYSVTLDGGASDHGVLVCWGTASMTMTGDRFGVEPNGHRAQVSVFIQFEFRDGLISRERFFLDLSDLCAQSGVSTDAVRRRLLGASHTGEPTGAAR